TWPPSSCSRHGRSTPFYGRAPAAIHSAPTTSPGWRSGSAWPLPSPSPRRSSRSASRPGESRRWTHEMSDLEQDLELAFAGAFRAGVVAMASFGEEHVVTEKAPDQPVTAVDLEADRLLREMLTGPRPRYGWLSEEAP